MYIYSPPLLLTYVCLWQGVCPGWLQADAKELRFTPDNIPLVRENGREPYTVSVGKPTDICIRDIYIYIWMDR